MFTRLIKDESGQGVVEYAGVLAIAGVLTFYAWTYAQQHILPAVVGAMTNAQNWLGTS